MSAPKKEKEEKIQISTLSIPSILRSADYAIMNGNHDKALGLMENALLIALKGNDIDYENKISSKIAELQLDISFINK